MGRPDFICGVDLSANVSGKLVSYQKWGNRLFKRIYYQIYRTYLVPCWSHILSSSGFRHIRCCVESGNIRIYF